MNSNTFTVEPRSASAAIYRRYAVGAELQPGGGAHFRVWAPRRQGVHVVLEGGPFEGVPLAKESGGYFAGFAPNAKTGNRYQFRLDSEDRLLPDPASRFQPDGPHGASQIVDPRAFQWTDEKWGGIGAEHQVLYEMHVGTFTPEGTWESAIAKLAGLAELGITCLEVMPVSEFPGRFGWGYDGVDMFAPTRLYGKPDDFRRFVDRAHALGLAVILDVVYNHFGPDGNYLKEFSNDYFSVRHKTDWGEALNYDAAGSAGVRDFFIANAAYWIEEYHLDGYRFDATQNIYDDSADHILAAVTRAARAAAGNREIYLIAENETQDGRIVRRPEQGGYGMDALWNDDFHHSAMARLSGHNEAYYSDYKADPQEFISAAKWGYLFQGQHSVWQKKRRGTSALDLPPAAFVTFIENHDQVSNFPRGLRSHQMAGLGLHRTMTALMLLTPQTPMFFQGQEFGATAPFYYFADHHEDLAKLVRKGRGEAMCQFPSAARPEMAGCHADPGAEDTFRQCVLDWSERDRNAATLRLHADLLKLRREDPVFREPRRGKLDGAVLGADAFVLRFFGREGDDRLLLINFGIDLHVRPAPEPLLAAPGGTEWEISWSSEDPRYGGCGTVPPENQDGWRLPGRAAVVVRPRPV